MKITVLGSGSAYGIPMIFNNWGSANPNNPKNHRTRASIVIEEKGKSILIDAGPDLRFQINATSIKNIDSVLITHGHYDHMMGIPELLRAIKIINHGITVYASQETMAEIKNCYGYLFKGDAEGEPESKSLQWQIIPDNGSFETCGLQFETMQVVHHNLHPSSFRYKNFAYVTDWEQMPEENIAKLQDLELLIIECNNGQTESINGHSNLVQVKEIVAKINPQRVILTHLSARVDADELEKQLPSNFEIAYDGMEIEI